MRKTKDHPADTLRPEYKRADFGRLERGKYVSRLQESSNVVVLDPEVTALFPNAASVNAALLSLAEVAKRSARVAPGQRTRRTDKPRRRTVTE